LIDEFYRDCFRENEGMNLKKINYRKPPMRISINVAGRTEDVTLQCVKKLVEQMTKEHGGNHTLLFEINLKV